MKTSDEGIRLNKSFEGYHKRLANGDCTAYQTYLGGGQYDIPTIGYGTTRGVKIGMVMTEAQATASMMNDLEEAERYVAQYVTVPINQNQHDALVLFTNNCGPGNLKKLIAPLNKGDVIGTANKFSLYVKAQGRTLPGLVSRRAREQALFLKPVEAPEEPYMPKTVQKEVEPPSRKTVATVVAAVTGTATQFMPALPDDPLGTAENIVSTGQRVKSVAEQGNGLYGWLSAGVPVSLIAAAAGCAGLFWLVCFWLPKKMGANS